LFQENVLLFAECQILLHSIQDSKFHEISAVDMILGLCATDGL